jgi:glycosyltransferase involved in cell wall biosynthesis
MTLVVNLIDFSQRNSWLESQFPIYSQRGIGTALISISSKGPIHAQLQSDGFEKIKYFNHGILGFLKASFALISWARHEKVYVYAHGHIPSIYASALKIFTGTTFVICHHQQPEFFSNLATKGSFKPKLHMLLARIYYRKSAYIQSFSPEVTLSLTKRNVPPGKVLEIPLGVKFDSFPRLNLDNPAEVPESHNVVSIGRLVWEKRIDLGIQTVAKLINSGQRVQYRIIGEGPELEKLKTLAKGLKIDSSVEFLGFQENVPQILSGADVLLHLAVTESYGQVLLESRLCGTPIYTSAVGVGLEMERLCDPMVRLFRTSDAGMIASGLLDYLQSVENLKDENKVSTMYSSHEFECAINTVISKIWLEGF